MYAIIEDSGTQIKVSPGDVLEIDLREGAEAGQSIQFDRVLAVGNGDAAARIGTPYLPNAKVTAEILEEIKGEKLTTVKFRRRKGYKKKFGHRQRYLRVRIGEVTG